MELTMPEWNRVVKRQYRTTKEFKNLDEAVQRFIILKTTNLSCGTLGRRG